MKSNSRKKKETICLGQSTKSVSVLPGKNNSGDSLFFMAVLWGVVIFFNLISPWSCGLQLEHMGIFDKEGNFFPMIRVVKPLPFLSYPFVLLLDFILILPLIFSGLFSKVMKWGMVFIPVLAWGSCLFSPGNICVILKGTFCITFLLYFRYFYKRAKQESYLVWMKTIGILLLLFCVLVCRFILELFPFISFGFENGVPVILWGIFVILFLVSLYNFYKKDSPKSYGWVWICVAVVLLLAGGVIWGFWRLDWFENFLHDLDQFSYIRFDDTGLSYRFGLN